MKTKRMVWVGLAAGFVVMSLIAILGVLWSGWLWEWGLLPRRTLHSVERGSNARDCNLASLDLRDRGDLVYTLGFNQRTLWPSVDRLPAGFVPGAVLTNAMNPGLGVRQLHRQGISGKGVSVAIIDYPILGRHPEYAGRIEEIHSVCGAQGSSMHGPAVASLLAGRNCGTAPDARVYFLAVPDPGGDARAEAEALDWVTEKNRSLAPANRIRAVSVSSNPSGPGSPSRNGKAWEEAVARAEKAGVLVVDGTLLHGFLGPCNLDLQAPDEVSRCVPIPSHRGPKLFADRLLVPVAPRTVADEYFRGARSYHYCGWMDHTTGMFGTSWSMPYCVGVLALGWQVNPQVSGARMKQLLFESAFVRPDGTKIINPPAFIEAVKREPST